jgi:peptidoglycan hydrolase CwlO-like protein
MDSSIATIIVAIITSLGGIIGAYLAVQKGNRESEIKDAQREQRQSDRLDRIDERISSVEKKVDIHNGYAEKFGEIATSMTALSKDIEYLKNRSK